MNELKAGDTKSFDIGGQKLVIEAVPFGNLKKILKMVTEVGKKNPKDLMESLPTTIETYIDQLLPLLVRKGDFLTKEWIDGNMTLPQMREIVESAIAVNGLKDFLGATVKARAPEAVMSGSSATNPIQPENSGSIISPDSPTVGDLATLTS